MELTREEIGEYIRFLESLFGSGLVIDDLQGILREIGLDFPAVGRWHTHPYCMKMKEGKRIYLRCVSLKPLHKRAVARHPEGVFCSCFCGMGMFCVPVLVSRIPIAQVSLYGFRGQMSRNMSRLLGCACHRSEKAVWEDHEALPAFDTGSPLCAAVRELARMIRQFCLESPEGADRIARLEQRKEGDHSVQLAREFLETHFSEPIGVAEIARAALISPSYLKHLFKEQTGTTLMAELCDIRLRRACELLSRTDRGIREIALTVGFRDPDYFSAVFRKKRGETPLAYRRRKRREG